MGRRKDDWATQGSIVRVAVPPYGQELKVETVELAGASISTHAADACAGEFCCFHKPSDHPLRDADMVLRLDRDALIERVCEHGIGHSDPDSLAWQKSVGLGGAGGHGCDGCCT